MKHLREEREGALKGSCWCRVAAELGFCIRVLEFFRVN